MYDRSREQGLAGLLVGWAVLVGLAAVAAGYPKSHLWHEPWFLTLAVLAGIAGLFGVWALFALAWDKVPFPRVKIPDTYAQHIGLKELLTAARDQFYADADVALLDDVMLASYAGEVHELLSRALGRGEAADFGRAATLGGDGFDDLNSGAAGRYLDGLIRRVDGMPVRRDFDWSQWRERIENP